MVDMQGLTKGVVGFGVAIVSVVMLVILLDQLGQTPNIGNDAVAIAQNGTDLLGSIITTWGDIALLGLVVVTIFAGMLAALFFIARQGGGKR